MKTWEGNTWNEAARIKGILTNQLKKNIHTKKCQNEQNITDEIEETPNPRHSVGGAQWLWSLQSISVRTNEKRAKYAQFAGGGVVVSGLNGDGVAAGAAGIDSTAMPFLHPPPLPSRLRLGFGLALPYVWVSWRSVSHYRVWPAIKVGFSVEFTQKMKTKNKKIQNRTSHM